MHRTIALFAGRTPGGSSDALNDPHVVDLTIWSNTVNKAAVATSKAAKRSAEPPAYGEEDEVDRARREGWASPRFGRR